MRGESMLRNYLPTTDIQGLYWEKVKTVFWAGFDDYDYATAFVALGHLMLLPVSITVVPPLMTLSDLLSRNPLPDEDIKKIKSELAALDDNQFAEVVDAVIHTPAQNDVELTEVLKKKLEWMTHNTTRILQSLHENTRANVKRETAERLEAEAVARLFPGQKNISLYLEYELTPDDEERISKIVQIEADKITRGERQKQEVAITEYLDNKTNAGSNLEHVIHHEVEMRFKP
jgi:hypothetical protein